MALSWLVLSACGGESAPMEPPPPDDSPPRITASALASTLPADGEKTWGTIDFEDADGDVIRVHVQSDNPPVLNSFSFDPGVLGQTQGQITLTLSCQAETGTCVTGEATGTIELEDQAGLRSEGLAFSLTLN